MTNINCKYYDNTGNCSVKPRVMFGLFRQPCVEFEGYQPCEIKVEMVSRPPMPKCKPPMPMSKNEQIAELVNVLRDYHNNYSMKPKSCGHDFICDCSFDEAERLLEFYDKRCQ